MKKLFFPLFALMAFVFLGFTRQTFQNDPKAKELLDGMSKKYQSMSSYKATFTYSLEGKVKETLEGEILVRGSKYRLKVGKTYIINDGSKVYTHTEGSSEATRSTYNAEEDEMNPAKIFTLYQEGYKYLLMADEVDQGVTYSVIDLEPLDRKNSVSKIRLVINKKDKTLKSWKIYVNNGNLYSYVIRSFTPEAAAKDSDFTFNKTGVDVIDMD